MESSIENKLTVYQRENEWIDMAGMISDLLQEGYVWCIGS